MSKVINFTDRGLHRMRTDRGGRSDQVGFTAPTLIYSEMRAIDASARSLLGDYQRNITTGEPARLAYESWFSTVWTPFFEKSTATLGAKIANAFSSDDLKAETDVRRNELDGFYAKYRSIPAAPPPSAPGAPPPTPSPTPETPTPSWFPSFFPRIEVPWWGWVLGTGAVVGASYLLYKTVTNANREMKGAREWALRAYTATPGFVAGAPAAARDAVVGAGTAAASCLTCGK